MLTILLGKTCSGKTTIRDRLVNLGLKPIITYTTRPMRDGEVDGETYHFISEDEFVQKVFRGFFAEWKRYETTEGEWLYGTALEDLQSGDDSVIILTPAGLDDLVDKYPDIKHKSLYVYSNNTTIKRRLLLRGDNKAEAERRVTKDNEDFRKLENRVDRIFYNNFDTNLDDLVDAISNYLEDFR